MLQYLIIYTMKQQCHSVKLLFLIAMLLMPLFGFAQKDIYKIPIPVKSRVVNYTDTCKISKSQNKAQLLDKAAGWLSKSFKGDELGVELTDKAAGKIKGKGIFKIITSDGGNYYWLKFNISITITDSTCILNTLNYYEKPIENGISNEYSKIEYRWGDYKRGKPWSAEDEKIFLGLNSNSLALLASFHSEMSK